MSHSRAVTENEEESDEEYQCLSEERKIENHSIGKLCG